MSIDELRDRGGKLAAVPNQRLSTLLVLRLQQGFVFFELGLLWIHGEEWGRLAGFVFERVAVVFIAAVTLADLVELFTGRCAL